MRRKPLFWCLLTLVLAAVAAYWWRPANSSRVQPVEPHPWTAAPGAGPSVAAKSAPAPVATAASPGGLATNAPAKRAAAPPLDPKKLFPYRLSNTDESYAKLIHNDRGILLMNALMDTGKPLNLPIPKNLTAPPDNGSYIVQARGALDNNFRAALAAANATIISYVPNNAYLVRVSEAGAQELAGVAQSVLPYEPYYKLEPALLKMAIETPDALPSGGALNVTLFPDAGNAGLLALQQAGAQVTDQDRTPFGPVVKVFAAPGTLAEVASLPPVQGVSTWYPKHVSNDLMRPTLGVSVDSTNPANYIGLSGSNVLVSINDEALDTTHPDLDGNNDQGLGVRIYLDDPADFYDTAGHGTHVAGTILGTGAASTNQNYYPNGVPAYGSVSNANFRGMASDAFAYMVSYNDPDSYLQQTAADVGALISNNSWNYGSGLYDIFAASYDAAVRDADPSMPGPQPVLFVFSAGNVGGGNDDGTGGSADSILSPATAKNVITVGALELPRYVPSYSTNYLTNLVTLTNGMSTNMIVTNVVTNIVGSTDSGNQVAFFSSRGNVGLFTEGTAGRFKPDVVAPGTFVVSCRSTQWNQTNYYNPTNDNYLTYPGLSLTTNQFLKLAPLGIPDDAVAVHFYVIPNASSPTNFPSVPIYGVLDALVTTNDFLATNTVFIPSNGISLALNQGSSIYFGLLNTNSLQTLDFDVLVDIITTNYYPYVDDGLSFPDLENLNNQIGPYYRYESGTSMSAAGISGMLADIQDYFQNRLETTISPAMMKALLINGARNAGQNYDFGTSDGINSEGWGLPSLPNSIPGTYTNYNATNAANLPMLLFDQTNLLATGQSATWNFTLTPDAQNQDLRITLVWTDPPGNPNVGTKLVNDLDLIVTDNAGDVFYGNDIPLGNIYNEYGDTNAPITDSVNNVENVFIQAPQASGTYTVTVLARRVNVNAVTANTNNIVQDFALVISSGDAGSSANPLAMSTTTNAFSTNATSIVAGTPPLTNVYVLTNGVPLFYQRVGANSQFAVNTSTTYATNGVQAQWNFYVYTNIPTVTSNDPNAANYTNVAIAIFFPPNLGVPRMGAYDEVDPSTTNATRDAGADLDLYVSTDPTLTNLNPNAISNAFAQGTVSVNRTGTQAVLLTNSSPGTVYYIGVKAEDQQAGQFELFADSTDLSFNQTDTNGNVIITILGLPAVIPPGLAVSPQHAQVFGFTSSTASIRSVVVTNTVQYTDFGNLTGTLQLNGTKTVALNNRTFFTNTQDAAETFVYDDSGQTPGARHSDGPGSLENFTAAKANGAWVFTMVNDAATADYGSILNFGILVKPQILTNRYNEFIPPNSWFYNYVQVPADATNLTIYVAQESTPAEAVQLYIKEGSYPTNGSYDVYQLINPPGGSASITKYTSPPLNAGTYYYGIYNGSTTTQEVSIYVDLQESLAPVAAYNFLSVGNEPIIDDAVNYSTNYVRSDSLVVSAEVGVRIVHPRESDLVLTLISPEGTRVLLAENRGGLDTNGYGSGFNTTNLYSPTNTGGLATVTNFFPLSTNFGSVPGVLEIGYQFFNQPDDLQVYYAGSLIYDTSLVSGSNSFSVNFGPGTATNLEVIVNYPGTNPTATNGDAWTYTAAIISENISYAFFTEDTNKTLLPIKFAGPPFGAGPAYTPPVTLLSNSFEGITAGTYASGPIDAFWTSLTVSTNSTNQVVTVPALTAQEDNPLADTNVLALHDSTITATLPTVAGRNYTLSFESHGTPSLSPIGWWKGDGNPDDSSAQDNLSHAYYLGAFTNGIVGEAFSFDPESWPTTAQFGLEIDDPPLNPSVYVLTNSLSIEGWIRPRGASQFIFCRQDNLGNTPYALTMQDDTTLEFFISDGVTTNFVTAPLSYNQWWHIAATLDGNTGLMSIYTNGILANATNAAIRPVGTVNSGGIGIGNTYHGLASSGFIGDVDEIALYNYSLPPAVVQDIYAAGSAGKCTNSDFNSCGVTFNLVLGNNTNQFTSYDQWSANSFTFTAPTANLALTILPATNGAGGLQDGTLLDSFSLSQGAIANPTNYYLPEEPLTKLVGENALGNWLLEVLDNRAGPLASNAPTLVSWDLSLVLADTTPYASPLSHHIPQTNTVEPNSILYYKISVPLWAGYATNILDVVSGSPAQVNLLFNQAAEPTGSLPGDVDLIPAQTTGTGIATLNTNNGSPLLVPGQTYYLGVQNPSVTTPVTFTIEVDFNITTLTNAVPLTNTIAGGILPRYYQFDVASNAVAAEFQILNPSGNVELVASSGPPLPDQANYAYASDQPGATPQPQNIIVITNSTPVPLAPGRWYLGVFNNDLTPVTYTIVATETGPPTIIPLANGVPVHFSAPPGPPFSTFFSFASTNASAALFELYNLTGNVDLSLDTNALPYVAARANATSTNPGTNEEQIVVRTTNSNQGANLLIAASSFNGTTFYLGVPNDTSTVVSYTIRASLPTNGFLMQHEPLTVTATIPSGGVHPTLSWTGVTGNCYELQYSTNLVTWISLSSVITAPTPPIMYYTDPTSPAPTLRFYRIIEVNCGP